LAKNRKAAQITREDLMTWAAARWCRASSREPEFVGQTKDRLATTEAARLVEGAVRDHFDNWLAADTKAAGAILDFWCCAPRNACAAAPKRKPAARPPPRSCACPASWWIARHQPRRDRAVHRRGRFGGRIGQDGARPRNQALLPLRGKILNVLGAASAKMGQNAEINDLCQALGVGMGTKFRLDDLRYDKVIIMTDADVDGAHIAALLMTFFFTQMRPMIDAGHLYLACPPLFRLTQGARRSMRWMRRKRRSGWRRALAARARSM
jgi:topoisomerase IV subunit B